MRRNSATINKEEQSRLFPGEPRLRNIIVRAAIAGDKGLKVRPTWRQTIAELYVGGDDYELLHHFGYLSELKTRSTFPGSSDQRTYACLTEKGYHLYDWSVGAKQYSKPGVRPPPPYPHPKSHQKRRAS